MKFSRSAGRWTLPAMPPETGNSQSMSTPSKPWAVMNSTQLWAKSFRAEAVAAALEMYLE